VQVWASTVVLARLMSKFLLKSYLTTMSVDRIDTAPCLTNQSEAAGSLNTHSGRFVIENYKVHEILAT